MASRADYWWLWLVGDIVALAGLGGAIGQFEGLPGFPAFGLTTWFTLGGIGVLLIIAGAALDHPKIESRETYR